MPSTVRTISSPRRLNSFRNCATIAFTRLASVNSNFSRVRLETTNSTTPTATATATAKMSNSLVRNIMAGFPPRGSQTATRPAV